MDNGVYNMNINRRGKPCGYPCLISKLDPLILRVYILGQPNRLTIKYLTHPEGDVTFNRTRHQPHLPRRRCGSFPILKGFRLCRIIVILQISLDRPYGLGLLVVIGTGDVVSLNQRKAYQHQAMTSLRLIAYISELSMTERCILFKQYEHIAKLISDCQNLIGAWINSDKKRFDT